MPEREVNKLRVYVGRFPERTRRKDVKKFFRGHGPIKRIDVITGFAFVGFFDVDEAERAIKNLDGRSLNGETVRLSHAYFRQRIVRPTFENVSTNSATLVEKETLQLSRRKIKSEPIPIGEVDFGYNGSNVTKIPGSILKVKDLYLERCNVNGCVNDVNWNYP